MPGSRSLVAMVAATALTLSACAAVEEAIAAGVSGEGASQIPIALDVRVLAWMDEHKVPGATVAVTKGSRLVWSKGYGVADLDTGVQMESHHRTRIGSVSKLITAIGALQLVEQDVLDLEDHLYTSSVDLPSGATPGQTPEMVIASDGILEDPGSYLAALVDAVDHWMPHEADPWYLLPPYLHPQNGYEANVAMALDWASSIQLQHPLSHTSGLLRSGDLDAAAAHTGKDADDVTYPELHEVMLMGHAGLPLEFQAGTDRKYSNHGFGLLGQVIAEASGVSYIEYTEKNILHPLWLDHVVSRDLASTWRDASSYIPDGDGNPRPPLAEHQEHRTKPTIATSTGSWIATARDVVRIMCAIDTSSNHRRLLDESTASTMATIAFPAAQSNQPLGWDKRTNNELTKNGATPRGGAARATKFLPVSASDAEINVVVAANMHKTPPESLLREIAKIVAAADIPDDYDLFAGPPCYDPPPHEGHGSGGGTVEPEEPDEPEGLVVPGPTPTDPPDAPRELAEPVPTDPPHEPGEQLAPEPTPTDPPREATPPRIDDLVIRPQELSELADAMTCGPTEARVFARVNPSGSVHAVELRWQIDDDEGSVALGPDGEHWTGVLGPFASGSVGDDATSTDVELTLIVRDASGETDSRATTVVLRACPPRPQ